MSGTKPDRYRPTRQTYWPGEQPEADDQTTEHIIGNRDQDFVNFILEDAERRRQAEAKARGIASSLEPDHD